MTTTSHITQGWVNPTTGESGTFDKDGKQRPWTRWERIVGLWRGMWLRWDLAQIEHERIATELRAKREAAAAEEKRRDEDWHYHESIERWRVNRPNDKWHIHLYKNPSLKQAYFLDHGVKHRIEWEAFTLGRVVELDPL